MAYLKVLFFLALAIAMVMADEPERVKKDVLLGAYPYAYSGGYYPTAYSAGYYGAYPYGAYSGHYGAYPGFRSIYY